VLKGPIQFIAIGFDGPQFKGEIVPALENLVNKEIVRIIDLVFVRKDANGDVLVLELEEVQDAVGDEYDAVCDLVSGLVSAEDAMLFAEGMENDTAGLVLVLEFLWAVEFTAAVRNAGGFLLADGYIPRDAVMELIEAYGDPSAI
jgi:hypothetical protein